jgi:hypothetical protein
MAGAVVVAAGTVTAAGTSGVAGAASASGPAYVSVLFGRAQYAVSNGCNPINVPPDVKTLGDVAQSFKPKGWKATPNVVVDYANSGRCTGRKDYASWSQLASLHATPYDWQAISASVSYPYDLAAMSAGQVQAESCGSLPSFTAHGFNRAWGLFAYPGGQDKYDKNGSPGSGNAQTDIVHNCFAFGRVYGGGVNARSRLHAPWIISALSPVGGTAEVHGGTYTSPALITRILSTGIRPDVWVVVQFYRFRSGYLAGDHNCLGPTNTHFTKFNEEYCWEDFETAMATVPAGAVVTDPATVACAWGRLPDAGPRPSCP